MACVSVEAVTVPARLITGIQATTSRPRGMEDQSTFVVAVSGLLIHNGIPRSTDGFTFNDFELAVLDEKLKNDYGYLSYK